MSRRIYRLRSKYGVYRFFRDVLGKSRRDAFRAARTST